MRLGALKRWIAALVAVACVSALAPSVAQACSCAPNDDLADRLARGRPALVGEVVAAQRVGEPPAAGTPEFDVQMAYTVRVERAFNGDLGSELTIVGNTNGASCGFTWSVGQRIGAFVGRSGDAWTTGLCSLVDPAQLIAAADAPPPQPPAPPGPPTPPTPPAPPVDTAPLPPGTIRPLLPALQARVGRRVAAGGERAGADLERLPARAGRAVPLRLDAPARRVRLALARADGRRLGPLRAAKAAARSGREAWTARLPRVLPRRADRLLVVVDYRGGKPRAAFAVGLGRPLAPSAAGATCRRG